MTEILNQEQVVVVLLKWVRESEDENHKLRKLCLITARAMRQRKVNQEWPALEALCRQLENAARPNEDDE